jgi:hypothetical protein
MLFWMNLNHDHFKLISQFQFQFQLQFQFEFERMEHFVRKINIWSLRRLTLKFERELNVKVLIGNLTFRIVKSRFVNPI